MRVAAVSSALAPVALVGGFVLAQTRQSAAYDAVDDTISALAARGATDRWIMSVAFVALGLCHLVTAIGLHRALLGVGGIATALLAIAPQPVHGSSTAHLTLAAVSLIALAIWPVHDRAWRPTVVLVALLVWFFVALQTGSLVGLSERIITVAEALWPIFAVHQARPQR